MTRIPRAYSFAILLVSFACGTHSEDTRKASVVEDTTTLAADEVRYNWGGNLDSERLDSTGAELGGQSKFEFRADQFRSGTLKIFLDTAPIAWSKSERRFLHFAGDSIIVTGLTDADRFTDACSGGPGPYPRVGVLRDSVYERPGRPRFLWHLDTVNVRIRPLPIDDSASCSLAGH